MAHQKRVTMEATDDGGFIIRATKHTKKGDFEENIEVADKFEVAIKKMKKHFKEGKKL